MKTKGPWTWRWTVLKTIKMTLVRALIANLKMTVGGDCAVSAYSHRPPLSIKALTLFLWRGWGESAFGQMSATLPPQLPASEIKQTFLSTNLACLLAFERQAARPHHAVSVTPKLVNVVSLLGLINESHLSTLLQNVVQNVILSGKLSHRATCMQ